MGKNIAGCLIVTKDRRMLVKFKSVNELHQFSFDDSEIQELKFENGRMEMTLNGAMVKAKNSQNARYQDMYCGTIQIRLEKVTIARLMKEGMKYYDANGELQREIPDEDIPAPAQEKVLARLAKGMVFTTVEDRVDHGYAWEFGIDVPKEEDEEEVDTFWLCVLFEGSVVQWDRYCSPAEQ